jgi:hypothetical protein
MGILSRPRGGTRKASEMAQLPCRWCHRIGCNACLVKPPRCRYCGRVAQAWDSPVCSRCELARTRIETGAMAHFPVWQQRGWKGPPTIGDDELLVTIARRLRDAAERRLALDEQDKRRDRRRARIAAQPPRPATDTRTGQTPHYNPQKCWRPGLEAPLAEMPAP